MPTEFKGTRPVVLMIGAGQLVCDNVRVLLRTMGCRCLLASSLPEALILLEKEQPDAAVLDPQRLASSPAEFAAAVQKIVFRLQRRVVVLTRGEGDAPLPVLDAYSFPKIPVDLVFQGLWPCLDSLLRSKSASRQVMRKARLVFDSELEPLPAGVRATQPSDHTLIYESGDVMVDLWLEPHRDSQRIKLVGQVLQDEKTGSQLSFIPVLLQGHAGPIEAAATNEQGEFQFDFYPHSRLRLEIGFRENDWIAVELPEPKDVVRET